MKQHFWAEFVEIGGDIFRFDTRIYLRPVNVIEANDICIGTIVGKNPGSAKSTNLGNGVMPIELDGDKLLPTVKNIVCKAFQNAEIDFPQQGYIQVLNLFYLCNPNLNIAISKMRDNPNATNCPAEKKEFPWVWYVWGGNLNHLNKLKTRFKYLKTNRHFYFDKDKKKIVTEIPGSADFAKHTQGLKHDYVVPYIFKLVKNG